MAHLPARPARRSCRRDGARTPGTPSAAVPRGVRRPPTGRRAGWPSPRRGDRLRRAQRQSADRADLLLELAAVVGVDRQVAGVVRPRRDLVDEELAARQHEHLDADHADHVPRLEQRTGDLMRRFAPWTGRPRRPDRQVEDVVDVQVLEWLVERDLDRPGRARRPPRSRARTARQASITRAARRGLPGRPRLRPDDRCAAGPCRRSPRPQS